MNIRQTKNVFYLLSDILPIELVSLILSYKWTEIKYESDIRTLQSIKGLRIRNMFWRLIRYPKAEEIPSSVKYFAYRWTFLVFDLSKGLTFKECLEKIHNHAYHKNELK